MSSIYSDHNAMKLVFNHKKKTENHAKTWKLNNIIKQWMGQQWDQGRNQKIHWNNRKSMGHWESDLNWEIHSIIGLP